MSFIAREAPPAAEDTRHTGEGPDLGRISGSLVDMLEPIFAPLQIFFRVPYRMQFASDVCAPSAAVWAHASSARGVNAEMAPFLSVRLPAEAPLPSELRSEDTEEDSQPVATFHPSATSLNDLLVRHGREEVEGLVSTPPVELLCGCTLLLFSLLPIDVHLLGYEGIWREKHVEEHAVAEDELVSAPVIAGFDEVSSSLVQKQWTHSRSVTHVPAEAVQAATAGKANKPAVASYTRITDAISIHPRACFILFFPLIFFSIWLLFQYRHWRLRSLFGRFTGAAVPAAPVTLQTKPIDVMQRLAHRTAEELEAEAAASITFVPPGRIAPPVADDEEEEKEQTSPQFSGMEAEGEDDESFQLVSKPGSSQKKKK